ncbi:MAG: SDR family NAD(P)-dependent oxidoreductase [Treponema sp.]|nr:SDR family NAD(P)-dependent oxidoreductase [Treponema sp.]
MTNTKKTALVTGASGGIGLATAVALSQAGYKVYGTSRNPTEVKRPEAQGIEFLPLELSDKDSIKALAAKLPPLDVLVNNAGSSLMGTVEETPLKKMRALYDMIFFGNVRLIRHVLPKMRERGQGLIINISSLAELMPVPCAAVYASAKAALHTLGNGLRHELRPFGIHVVTVAPSFVKTDIYQERLICEGSIYADMIKSAGNVRDAGIRTGCPPEDVAKTILKIIKKKNPASFYPAGKKSGLLSFAFRWLPEKMRERAVQKRFNLC